MSSSFVMSSSSFLARPRMYFSESVVAMAYGVPAMLTLTLFTMVFSPFFLYLYGARPFVLHLAGIWYRSR